MGKMNILLKLLPHDLPDFIRRKILMGLFEASADAFECPLPMIDGLTYDEQMRSYALFTREQAENALRDGLDIAALKARLYQKAFPLGARIRKWLGIDKVEEVMELGQILYRAIGVAMQGDASGNITVHSCYFSQYYTGPVCELISALDDGVFSGLSGGGRLEFCQRLTEAKAFCFAKLTLRCN
jgi:hypothetical protein